MGNNRPARWIIATVVVAGVAAASLGFLATQVMRPFKLPTGAMEPTLRGITKDDQGHTIPGDHFFVSPISYRLGTPQRGDVVVFATSGIDDHRVQKDTYYVKRIVGLPGEVVAIEPPKLMINGTPITNPPIFTKLVDGTLGTMGYQLPPSVHGWRLCLSTKEDSVTLGTDEYFVLGDNTMNSLDSRYFGPIKREALLGPAWYIYFPFHRVGQIE